MIIGKYNIAAGTSSARQGAGASAVDGGGAVSVDLSPITDKVSALEAKVSALELLLGKANAVLAGLDSRFLSKLGDRSDYSYRLGAVYTDFLQSGMFDNGVGYRISGDAAAPVEDKYNIVVKDVGYSTVAFNTVQGEASIVDADTDEATAQLDMPSTSIGATSASGYLLVDCGALLTSERCFTTISRRVLYTLRARTGQQIWYERDIEADVDSNGNFIILFDKADDISISIRFVYTYSFRRVGDMASGTYRLYIRGTDYANSQTDCFAATLKTSTMNAGGITVMNGLIGARITSGGLQTTADGGTTWT